MSSIFTKLRDFVGLNDPVDYEEYEYEEAPEADEYQELYREQHPQKPPAPAAMPEEDSRVRRRLRERSPLTASEVGMLGGNGSMSNVIGMPGSVNGISEVVVMEPRSFEEMPQAIQALRERKSVVLNLNVMDPDQAQRAVDFVAGGTYAIDGHQERIGESIFLFTPSCVQVTTQAGVSHEAPQPARTPTRPATAPTPAWTTEPSARMA
ncbi:MAG: cell division protein SepF [Cyanobacteria bacterium]|nr:cell division protein SepF [Cyanobacteriota bacterium]MDW8200185.1 cell division protein SepF [Cyanobacteriota bacterium SKYGB_h_bin112]